MRNNKFILILIMSLLGGCSRPADQSANQDSEAVSVDQNILFVDYTEIFLDEFWSYSPDWATYVGYYKFDDKLIVPDAAARAAETDFINRSLSQLEKFDTSALSARNATDYALIKNQLESTLWYMYEFRIHEWDPSNYNVANIFGLIMNTQYKPLDERLLTVTRLLQNVPAYYLAAKQSIDQPTVELTRLAIEQNKGALGVFEKTIQGKIEESTLDAKQREELNNQLTTASSAIRGYITWLEQLEAGFADNPARDFRIGKDLYEKKFGFDIVSDLSAEQLYRKAIAEKDRLHARMFELTEQLWPKYLRDKPILKTPLLAIKQMIDHLSVRHIDREGFVDEIRRQIPIIQKFMDDNKLLDSDPTRPLVVRETPEYQRGFAGASVNAPGPYNATANTYYNVTPLDHYTPEQAESYLREYNHWILQILNIHEAIPGHYTQLMHANKSPSKIKSIFGNGAMIEGWAVYSELMMMEAGYGDHEPELWLMYSKWNLRAVINTIIDYEIQVLGLEREDAVEMLLAEGFQEQTEADEKWRRATLSQVQLTSYFSGYAEILAFREELKVKMGDKFDLRNFHNKFLSYGNAPVPVIRKLMLKELELPI
ncbi:MAG: DUF885 domain-containing protein [Gammaproteobacteria bacterium]|nr:MAG: DUF885 domain-containing protein [Gammaproteobacteria bacterium]